MRRVFQGQQGPIRDVVLLNSGAVLLAGDRVNTIREGIKLAAEVINTGKASGRLEALIELSQRLGRGE